MSEREETGTGKQFYVPITVVEYGRYALIEAETKQQAMKKFREGEYEWTDATMWKTTKAGRILTQDEFDALPPSQETP